MRLRRMLLASALVLTAGPAVAKVVVRVVVDSIANKHSEEIFRCLDPQPFGCGRADYYARMFFIDGTDRIIRCDPTPVVVNRDFPSPGWTCQQSGAEMLSPMRGPVRFGMSLWDFDGGLYAIDGDDPVDLGAGSGQERYLTVPLGTSSAQLDGPDAVVSLTFAATFVPTEFQGLKVETVPSGDGTTFAPVAGGQVDVSGALDDPEMDLFVVVVPNGSTAAVRQFAPPRGAGGAFALSWDGRDTTGNLVPDGDYRLVVVGAVPLGVAPVERPFQLRVRSPPGNALTWLGLTPADWAPPSGPLEVQFGLAAGGAAEATFHEGAGCAPERIVATLPRRAAGPGRARIAWDGRDSGGSLIAPGTYSVRLSGLTAGGSPTSPSAVCQGFAAKASPGMEVHVDTDPLVPVSGEPVRVVASALTPDKRPRRTGAIDIFFLGEAAFGTDISAVLPVASCSGASACSFTAPGVQVPPWNRSRFAYRAVARDGDGRSADTGYRAGQVIHPGELAGTGRQAPVMAGVAARATPVLGVAPVTHAIDVTFYPGSGYEPAFDPAAYRQALRRTARTLFGIGPFAKWSRSGPMLANQGAVSIWASMTTVDVVHGNPRTADINEDPCELGEVEDPSFSEVNGVLHRVYCRDATTYDSRYFTANDEFVTVHEMHHAAFGLADEYCCDSHYHEPSPYPNIYGDRDRCAKDPDSGGACTQLKDPLTKQTIDWWFFDPRPDVMKSEGDTAVQKGETRRMIWRFGECALGNC